MNIISPVLPNPFSTALSSSAKLCALDRLPELDDIGMVNGGFERHHDRLKRLRERRAKPFDLDLSNRHLFIPFIFVSRNQCSDHPSSPRNGVGGS
jgi:hypothetical protein